MECCDIVPSSLTSIAPALNTANEVEKENPRVAYLCRFHAFQKAHYMDPTSSGRGVRQFKTALLGRLEKDSRATEHIKDDAILLQNFYQQYYEKYMKEIGESTSQMERSQLSRDYQTAVVIFETLQGFSHEDEVKPAALKVPPPPPPYQFRDIVQLPEVIDIEEGIFSKEEEGGIGIKKS